MTTESTTMHAMTTTVALAQYPLGTASGSP